MISETVHHNKISKIDRYKWTVQDKAGELRYLNKHVLKISEEYQRTALEGKVAAIRGAWSWIACGVIIVGERGGGFWVIDGQHRVAAASSRADIQTLPCIVFQTADVATEARGFLNANTSRKAITSLDKFRASLAAQDEVAIYANGVFERMQVVPTNSTSGIRALKALGWAMRRATEDRDSFERTLQINAQLCFDCPMHERLLEGFWHLVTHMSADTFSKRVVPRAKAIGHARLLDSANRAAAYYARGGAKVFADGILGEMNKGLHHKIVLDLETVD